jgi:hypothetical protein
MSAAAADHRPGPVGWHRPWLTMGLLLALLAAIGTVHVVRLQPGHPWGDDFALYVLHARNLAAGIPYAQTGYVYDPHNPLVGPSTYPPISPLLLAPVYARFGLNFVALKGVSVACFLVFLFMLGLGFRRVLTPSMLLALVVSLGLNAFFLRDTNTINSDEPLLAFLYLSLFLIDAAGKAIGGPRRTVLAIAVGVSAYLAFGARTVGFLLIPAMLLEELFNTRRIRSATLLTVALFAIAAVAQGLWLHHDRDYLDAFTASGTSLSRNAAWYAQRAAAFWSNGYCQPAAGLLASCVTLLALVGYRQRWRNKPTVYEIFAPLYLGTILLWPGYAGERYLYPILPLWLFYGLVGLRHPLLLARPRLRGLLIGGLLAAVSVSYVARYTKADGFSAADAVGRPRAAAMFRFVAEHTQTSDVIVFIKPRAMALLAQRRASAYHEATEDRQLWDYFRSINARYVVAVERDSAMVPAAPAKLLHFLRDFVARNRSRFEEVYRNEDFAVYRSRD